MVTEDHTGAVPSPPVSYGEALGLDSRHLRHHKA